MRKKIKRIRIKQNAKDIGVCFEPLEPRLLLSGSWGAGVDRPTLDSQLNPAGTIGPQTFTVSQSHDLTGTEALLQNQHALVTGTFVDVLASAQALDGFNTDSGTDAAEAVNEAVPTSNQTTAEIVELPTNLTDTNPEPQSDLTGDSILEANYMSTPLAFEENVGQTDAAVDFLARGSGYSVFLSDADAILFLDGKDSSHVLSLNVVGAKSSVLPLGEYSLNSVSNYLLGGDSSTWQTDITQYGSVLYEDVYDGIDLHYYGNQRQLEYDFIVDAGVDYSQIRLNFEGAEGLNIAENGELVITLNTAGEAVRFKAPVAYQLADDGSREAVTSAYVIYGDGTVGFSLGAYDASRELVIDPILDYTTFVGGTGYDTIEGIAADNAGNVYITGWAGSTDFPTTAGALNEMHNGGSYDIYVAKLSGDGSSLVYSTFIGGSGNDTGSSVAVDGGGNVYIVGSSSSTDIPTVNAYQNGLNGTGNAVLLKLNSSGDGLLYASYFGGSGSETGYDLALDPSGAVLIAGSTTSSDLPTRNAYDTALGGTQDAFVAKFDLSQSGDASLVYASYFGGSGTETANTIAVDSTGAFTIAGSTTSSDLPILNAYQSSSGGGTDAFVTRFTSAGDELTYSTYLGGSGTDTAQAVAVDSSGNIYVGGRAEASFPTTAGAYDTTFAGGVGPDGFVTKLDPTQSGAASLVYSTYLGGTGFDYVIGLDVDEAGVAYLVGLAYPSFPTTADANDKTVGGANDGFFATLSADGGSLTYSTFIGGSGQDRAKDVVWNAATGSAYVGGQVELQDGPTSPTPTSIGPGGGGEDAYVAKFTFNQMPTATDNSYTVAEGSILNGNVITDNTGASVDSDPDSDPLTASLVNGPLHGTLVLNSDGSFTYTPYDEPASNFADSDSFTYQLSDGKGGTDIATVTISVTPDAANEAPVNTVPGAQITGQDIPLIFSEANGNRILLRDDAGGNTVEVTLTATNGTVTLSGTTGLSITGGADGSGTVTIQGTLTDLNNSLNGLTFTPNASYLGSASLQIVTNDLGNAPAAIPQSDSDVINIDVIAVNDPPVNTVPAAQITDLNGMVLFSSATGTAISVNDVDAGGSAIQVTLTATNGTLNLSGISGLSFSTGDGSADTTMTFTGTVADINSALEGMTFVAAADFTGTAGVQITTNDLGNSGAGGALNDTDTVEITVRAVKTSLWLSTADDVASPGAVGLDSWTAGQAIEFGETGGTLSFEPGTTTGAFSLAAFDLDNAAFGDANTRIDGIQYITRDMTVGGVALHAGDVLFTTQDNETLGGVSYENGDIILFRPTTAGDYSAGTFSLFFDKTDAGIVVEAFTLVETPVMVGNTLLNAGDLLLSEGAKDILRYVPTQLGDTTSGTQSVLIDGDGNLDFGKNITAIELVEHTSVIGDKTLQAGTLIVAVDGEDSAIGSGTQIAVTRFDLFTLEVSTTGNSTTSATAELLFEGADVQFDDNKEAIFGVSLIPNRAPTISDQGLSVDENSANGTVVGTVSGTDPEGGSVKFAIIDGNTDGAFAIDAATGQITVANSAALDYETTPTFTLTVAAIDPEGAYDTATVTINLNDLVENTAPTTSGITDFSVNEDIGLSFIDLKAIFDDAEDTDLALVYTIENNTNPGLFDATTINASGVLTLDYAADQNGAADITIRATDTGGLFVETSFTVTVNPVNDAPVLLTGSVNNLTVNEDSGFTSLGLGSVTYGPGGGSDESGQTLTYEVTVIPDPGTFGKIYLADGTTQVATGSYTLAEIQGMQFAPNPNETGISFFSFNVQDDGGTANGGSDVLGQSIQITVNPINDDPTNAGTMPTDLVFLQDTQGKLDLSAIDLSDIDANGGDLTLTITSAAGHLQTLGGVGLTLGGSQSQLILTGNLTDLNNFLNDVNAIDYEHATPGIYGNNVDLITIEINDNGNTGSGGGGTITLGTINIDIDPVAPQIDLDADDSAETGINFTTSWTQGGGQIYVADTDATITDADSATLQSLTVTLTNHLDGADERMVADTSGTSISVTSALGVGEYYVYLTGSDTVANYEQVLKSIIYDNTSATPDPTTRVVTVQASDGTNVSTVATTTINMIITNVAPVITSNGGGDAASHKRRREHHGLYDGNGH